MNRLAAREGSLGTGEKPMALVFVGGLLVAGAAMSGRKGRR